MKCDNCPALYTKGYEYPESYCAAGVPESSKMYTDGGCKYTLETIMRRVARINEMQARQYDRVGTWYEEQERHERAMERSVNETLEAFGLKLCHGEDGRFFLYNNGNADMDIVSRIIDCYESAESEIQKSYCDRCRWKDRYQKCTSCGRNLKRRDLFEEKKEK